MSKIINSERDVRLYSGAVMLEAMNQNLIINAHDKALASLMLRVGMRIGADLDLSEREAEMAIDIEEARRAIPLILLHLGD